ncbi:MAG: BrnT family toxin [Alphaproteobacteria bacterium]|nr:BrnT family toxin [Alphaproteobacteria bacterium]
MAKPPPNFVLVEEAAFCEFEWDEDKREGNWNTHEVDFEDVKEVFRHPHVVAPSYGYGESRWTAVGLLDDVEITVVFTIRDERCRLISARRARHYERNAYYEAIHKRSKKGQN